MLFFKKMFSHSSNIQFVEDFLQELFQASGLSLYCDVEEHGEEKEKNLKIDIYGGDEEMLTEHHGKLLRAFQIYISSVLRNKLKSKTGPVVSVDSQGFLEHYEKDLLDLAHKLKKKALREKRPMLIKRPLEAFYRRKIHQQLTQDGRVETKSIGEGVVKRIKIFPKRYSDQAAR